MGEADGQAPGPAVMAAREVVELARRVVGDLVVIFHLVGDLGNAGAGDRTQIVIPPVDAFAGLAVVRRPAEIGGIDVGRQPLLEAMQLVWADEMHLARQAGLVAGGAQMMREGRNVGGKFGGVVVDARAAGQLARHEGSARRCAERACRIGVGKRTERAASAFRCGACRKSAGPSGKNVPFSWSTIRMRMFGRVIPIR